MSALALPIPPLLRDPLAIAVAVVVVLLVVGEIVSPGFAAPRQVIGQLVIAALLGLVAAGQNLVILGGREGIDLSVGAMIGLGALIAGNMMQGQDGGILPAFLAVGAATFALGVLNGIGVTLLRIPPLVMTLGMAGVLQGLLVVLTRGQPSGNAAPLLVGFVTKPLVLGLPRRSPASTWPECAPCCSGCLGCLPASAGSSSSAIPATSSSASATSTSCPRSSPW
jgi:ribose transport system permease protein